MGYRVEKPVAYVTKDGSVRHIQKTGGMVDDVPASQASKFVKDGLLSEVDEPKAESAKKPDASK